MTERTRTCPFCGAAYEPADAACAGCGIDLTLPSYTRRPGAPAGPGPRALGALVDSCIVNIVALALVRIAPGEVGGVLVWIGIAGYDIAGHAIWGRTIGKVVARTRCEAIDGSGLPGFGRATVRWLVPAVPVMLAFVWTGAALLVVPWAIAVFAPIFAPGRRGLHDRAAGTRVVRA